MTTSTPTRTSPETSSTISSASAITPACVDTSRRRPRRRRPPPAPAPANRPPTVQARCEPCTVEAGRNATVTADAKDPDGDTLTYRWTAPTGTLQQPGDRQTLWTAPQQEGPVQLTVTVSDGSGGTASSYRHDPGGATDAGVELTFEDVYFDFDRSTLRPEALRLLDDAVAKLQAAPGRQHRHRRPHLQHRHGGVQPGARRAAREPASATTSRRAAFPRTGSRFAATVRSGRSSTTLAKRRGG